MPTTTLPDGLAINFLNTEELHFFYAKFFVEQAVLRHGVTLDDGAVIIDVGANIGLFALWANRTYKNLHLLAFEPVPEVFQVLLANLAQHAIEAKLYPCAAGVRAGEATFKLFVDNAVAREFKVPVRPLSEIITEAKLTRIDLLKIDVQNAELDVVMGVGDNHWAKIRQVVADVNDADGRLTALASLFTVLGFVVHVEQAPVMSGSHIWTLYAVRPAPGASPEPAGA